jgi:hypothetical protein
LTFWSNTTIGYRWPGIRIRCRIFYPRIPLARKPTNQKWAFLLKDFLNFWPNFTIGYRGPGIRIWSQFMSVLKKWLHYYNRSVCSSGWPSVYTITLHNYIRLSWNFVHIIVSSISRSSSKMRMIGWEMAELSKKLLSLAKPSLKEDTRFFQKKVFFVKIIKNMYESTQFLTLIPNLRLVLSQTVVS